MEVAKAHVKFRQQINMLEAPSQSATSASRLDFSASSCESPAESSAPFLSPSKLRAPASKSQQATADDDIDEDSRERSPAETVQDEDAEDEFKEHDPEEVTSMLHNEVCICVVYLLYNPNHLRSRCLGHRPPLCHTPRLLIIHA